MIINKIKQLFRAEVIEVAALRELANWHTQCPDSANWGLYEDYRAQALDMGDEYGFIEKDGEEVEILEGYSDLNEEFKIFDFINCGTDVIKAAGLQEYLED